MEENNKQLLIRDICARFPYGVYVKFKQYNEPLCLSIKDALAIYNGGEMIDTIQYLYLRPMSCMTEEERQEYEATCSDWYETLETYDWLNAHHFDFRNLIEKGLAIDCTGLNIY